MTVNNLLSREMKMAVIIDEEKCSGCGACADICPVDAIKIENDKAVINEECVECGACVSQCAEEAIAFQN